MLNNSNPGQGNIQLLIDPRGTILGTVASSQGKVKPIMFSFNLFVTLELFEIETFIKNLIFNEFV